MGRAWHGSRPTAGRGASMRVWPNAAAAGRPTVGATRVQAGVGEGEGAIASWPGESVFQRIYGFLFLHENGPKTQVTPG